MKRIIPIISLSMVFGVAASFMEGMVPSLDLHNFNIINFKLLFLLLSILIVLLLVLFSKNILTAVLSVFIYVFSFIAFKLYAKLPIGYEFYVRMGIIIFTGLLSAIFLFSGRMIVSNVGKQKTRIKNDVAFPLIFFLISVLVGMATVLFEQKDLYNFIPVFFYSYLYFLITISIILSFLSFNEISGFLIGSFSILIYFLMSRLIANNFDVSFLLNTEKSFALVVLTYGILFGVITSLLAHSSALLLKGISMRRALSKKISLSMLEKKPAENLKRESLEKKADEASDISKASTEGNLEGGVQTVEGKSLGKNTPEVIKSEASKGKKNKKLDS